MKPVVAFPFRHHSTLVSEDAKKMLLEAGILQESEIPYADKMLDAAAKTYVASMLTSLVEFLRFALWVLMIFGVRIRRD